MKKDKLKHFRQILLKKKADLFASVAAEEREGREAVSIEAKDFVDMAAESYGQELSFTISDAGRRMLRDIDGALRRIEDGSYGNCETCTNPIDEPRLEVLPQAKLCISCQENAEKNGSA